MLDIKDMDLWDQPDEGDPLVWLRKHREELSKKYPTIEALCEYYRQVPSAEESLARVQAKIAEKKQKEANNV
jgi:hypothetical protein